MADYIPGGDAEFNSWLDNFGACAGAGSGNVSLALGALIRLA